jgi:photosystem II stability/assembly factor-like uncharacterized protein
MCFVGEKNGWAVGIQGAIFHSTDGGQEWARQNSNTGINLLDLCFVDDQNGWAVGGWAWDTAGVILHTSDGGVTWNTQSYSNFRYFLGSVFFANQDEGWIGGTTSIYHTTNGGALWEEQFTHTDGWVYGIQFADSENGWALGENGHCFRTTNGGKDWFSEPSGIYTNLNGLCFVDKHNGWAVGDNGVILKWGSGEPTSIVNQQVSNIGLPKKYELLQNYPDPFNPTTTIRYQIPAFSKVLIRIYNVLGQEVATLVNEQKKAGTYSVEWNASSAPSGVYFYRTEVVPLSGKASTFRDVKKMVLLK